MAQKLDLEEIRCPTVYCSICDDRATIRLAIEDGACIVKVPVCLSCASMKADELLRNTYYR